MSKWKCLGRVEFDLPPYPGVTYQRNMAMLFVEKEAGLVRMEYGYITESQDGSFSGSRHTSCVPLSLWNNMCEKVRAEMGEVQ